MNDIIRLLPKLLEVAANNHEFVESIVKVAWIRAAGEGLRPHARPMRLSGDKLLVAVDDLLWKKQLQAISEELLARVNRVLGRNLIHFIEYCVDPRPFPAIRHTNNNQPEYPEEARLADEVLAAAEAIHDESLRKHFLLAAAAGSARLRDSGKSD